MEPENPFEKEIHLPYTVVFGFKMLVFGGVIISKKCNHQQNVDTQRWEIVFGEGPKNYVYNILYSFFLPMSLNSMHFHKRRNISCSTIWFVNIIADQRSS